MGLCMPDPFCLSSRHNVPVLISRLNALVLIRNLGLRIWPTFVNFISDLRICGVLMKQCVCLPPSILKLSIFASALMAALASAQNPVPQVVGPPHPQAVAPGGASFTLKVYGANFVPGSVVNWNRHPRSTTYVSGHELDATILASDIVKNTAGQITVTNPPPGGGISSSSGTLVEVHAPTGTIAPGLPNQYLKGGQGAVPKILVVDFNNDGIVDLADADGAGTIQMYLGNAAGALRFTDYATLAYEPSFATGNVAYGDFNGDGNLDIAYQAFFNAHTIGVAVSLGEGNGKFQHGWYKTDGDFPTVLAGDFNGDGKLDLIVGSGIFYVYLGNGDGTFDLFQTYKFGGFLQLLGDFDNDGKLDLAIDTGYAVSISLGNGDGTFQPPVQLASPGFDCAFSQSMQLSDFNGDGNLDIAYCDNTSISVLLGNGDGTFQPPVSYTVDTQPVFSFTVGDFNSDGKTDLIVSDAGTNFEFSILLGNGDGTFQPQHSVKILPKYSNAECGMAVGDFNSDGLLDFILQDGGSGFLEYLQLQP